ncbi:DUF6229 family protein [Embleya sp. NPDC127516]|uniref:DUF6229 family protein n=1 Tax=Embleya sp. NPDC127516 TaxID=3363990 RepID=UPI003808815C
MRTASNAARNTVVNAWRSGAASADVENPAGSLYIGGSATEQSLTEIDVAAISCGTACSGSRTRPCC